MDYVSVGMVCLIVMDGMVWYGMDMSLVCSNPCSCVVLVWNIVLSCIERVLPAYHNEKIVMYDQLGQIRVLAGKYEVCE